MHRNPGDRDLRDLERRAAQGDPAAQAQLDRMRERLRPRGLAEMPTIKRRRPSVVNEALVANLVMLADNERDLHEAQQRVAAGLIEKYLNGKYDPVKAERAWQSIADEAGRRYARAAAEYNDVRYGGGYGSATKPARYAAAQDLAQRFEEQARWGDERWEVLATQIAAGMLAKPKRRKKNPGDDRLRALERAARLGDPNALRGALHEAVRLRQPGVVYERLLGLAMDFGDQALIDEAASAYWHARGAFDKNACVDCGGEATRTSYLSQPNKHYCEACWNRACYGDTRSNPPGRGDDNLRSLERAYLAGDAAAAHAYNAELYRRGMHDRVVPRAPHVQDGTQNWAQRPARVAFYPYAPAGWYVISKNGTWTRAAWRTAEDALAAAADMINIEPTGYAVYVSGINAETHTDRRSNPGDEDRRRLERLAAQGDLQAQARLAAERDRLGGEQQVFAQVGDYLPWSMEEQRGTYGAGHTDGRFRSAGRRVDAPHRAYMLVDRLNSELSDDEVICAFVQRLGAHGRKLTSENLRLDGNWMGGRGIASWQQVPSNSVHLPPTALIVEHDLGSKAAERIQKKLRKAAQRAGVEIALPLVHRDRGRGDYTGVCGQTDRNSKLTSSDRAVTCPTCRSLLGTPRATNPAPLAIMGLGPLPAGLLNPAGGEEEYDVLSPGPGEKGKMGKKPKVVETKIKLADLEGLPGYKEALASYERFHGAKPTHGMALTVDDGKPGHTVKVVVGLGKVPETHYVTPWKSNKKGYHWIHHHPKGGEPFEVLDPVTGITSKIGGTFRVTDWWRK